MKPTYFQKLKDKITNKTDFQLDGRTLNAAMAGLERNAGYREKAILEDIESIEINAHTYPSDTYITASLYNQDGEGFEIIIKHDRKDRGTAYKPGDITG